MKRCQGMIRAVALLLLCAMSQTFVRATPSTVLAGRLTTTGNGAVYVNGSEVNSGMTILSGSQIITSDGIGATITLGALGQVDVAPNANLTVTFDDKNLSANISKGCVVLSANEGINGSVMTPQGAAQRSNLFNLSSPIDVCIGAETSLVNQGAAYAAGAGATLGAAPAPMMSKRNKGLLILAAAVTVVAVIIVASDDDDFVLSPSR